MSLLQEYHDAHKARLLRMSAVRPTPALLEAPPPPVETVSEWVLRQKAKFKEPWFQIESEVKPRVPTIREIQVACANHYGISMKDMLSARRTLNLVRPRQVGYFMCKALARKSLPEIGRKFGGRDHTTVLSGTRKIEQLRKTDAKIEADLHAIASVLEVSL